MKTKLQKLLGTAVLGLALCSQSLPAWAGSTTIDSEVYIQSADATARGTLTGARYSADSQQYIGCDVQSYAGPNPLVGCSARDKTGGSLYCFSSDARFADAVKAMTDSSFIFFRIQDGTCTDLEITNTSAALR